MCARWCRKRSASGAIWLRSTTAPIRLTRSFSAPTRSRAHRPTWRLRWARSWASRSAIRPSAGWRRCFPDSTPAATTCRSARSAIFPTAAQRSISSTGCGNMLPSPSRRAIRAISRPWTTCAG
ncbi:hypothetical protein CF98_09025 [Halopseudomonas bauzanensis]|nr:hypothetical protein CF98_09025 [Halopseudomonas bauzanensis]